MKDTYEIARERVQKKKDFYRHLRAFIVVSLLLVFVNLIPFFIKWFGSYPDAPLSEVIEEMIFYYPYWYVQYPIFGWGLGILAHFLVVFGLGKKFDKWEEKAIRQEIKRMRTHEAAEEEKMELKSLEKVKVESEHKKWDDSELV